MTARGIVAAFAAGLLFGIGLIISGMTIPAKVQGFLDFTGDWDPSLVLVMAGAVGVHLVASRWIRRRPAPLYDTAFHLPMRRDLDRRLLAGAAVFGVGWGLAGFCPGPALVAAASGATTALVFVATMTGGMLLYQATTRD